MKKLIILIAAISISAFADQRLDCNVNSVSVTGENQMIVNVSSPAQPTPLDLYIVVGQGFNNVAFTPGDVKTYSALFLSALSTGNKVDIIFAYTSDPRPLIQKATIKK